MLNFCDFIQVYVFTTNLDLKCSSTNLEWYQSFSRTVVPNISLIVELLLSGVVLELFQDTCSGTMLV